MTGFVFFAFWYTREEGIWLVPLLLLILAAAFFDLIWENKTIPKRNIRIASTLLFVPVFFLCQLYLKYLNYQHYGEFIALEINASYQEDAFNALYRVKQEGGAVPYMAINTATRKKIYEVSPSFKLAQKHLEKYPKKAAACMLYPATCGEIAAGWFHWYWYSALAKVGIYESASKAKNFYLSLAKEINTACYNGLLDCKPAQNQFLVHLRTSEDYNRWGKSIISGIQVLYNGVPPKSYRGYLAASKCYTEDRLELFREMTNADEEKIFTDKTYWQTSDYLRNKEKTIQQKLSILTNIKLSLIHI